MTQSQAQSLDVDQQLPHMARRIRLVNAGMLMLFVLIGGVLIAGWRYPVVVRYSLTGGRWENHQLIYDIPQRLVGRVQEGQAVLLAEPGTAGTYTGRVAQVLADNRGAVCRVQVPALAPNAAEPAWRECQVLTRPRTVGDIIFNR